MPPNTNALTIGDLLPSPRAINQLAADLVENHPMPEIPDDFQERRMKAMLKLGDKMIASMNTTTIHRNDIRVGDTVRLSSGDYTITSVVHKDASVRLRSGPHGSSPVPWREEYPVIRRKQQ